MSCGNVFVLLGIIVLLRVPEGATDKFSDVVGFVISYRGLYV